MNNLALVEGAKIAISSVMCDNARLVWLGEQNHNLMDFWSFEVFKNQKFVHMGYVRSFTEHDYYYHVLIRLTKSELYKAINSIEWIAE